MFPSLCSILGLLSSSEKTIILGGASRSGKSTLATQWCLELEQQGYHPVVCRLDDYLGGPSYQSVVQQPDGSLPIEQELAQKYNYAEIAVDLQQLLAAKEVRFPIYHRASRTRQGKRQEPLVKRDFLIVEGTPALMIPALEVIPAVRVYASASQHEREQLLLEDWIYRKGHSSCRAHELLHYRRQREEPFIQLGAEKSDVQIYRKASDYVVQLG